MSKNMHSCWGGGVSLENVTTLLLASALMTLPCASLAGDAKLSDDYSMNVDPLAKEKAGEADYQLLMNFFHEAERAIESENIEELMALYSDKYSNLDQDKKFAERVWTKIFANFDDLSAKHSMDLLTYEEDLGQTVAVLECSGLLRGIPKGGDQPVTVDSWDKQWHVLIKEGGWRLLGNSGKAEQRYGSEERSAHPLF